MQALLDEVEAELMADSEEESEPEQDKERSEDQEPEEATEQEFCKVQECEPEPESHSIGERISDDEVNIFFGILKITLTYDGISGAAAHNPLQICTCVRIRL